VTIEGHGSPAAPAPAATRRPHRVRNLVLIVAAFFVALGAIAGGALLFFYDRTTAIDRSTPQIVTDQFLDSALALKDPARVALYVCDSWSAEQAMQAIDAPTDPRVSPFWGDPVVETAGDSALVSVRVIFRVSVDGGVQQQVQMWTLSLVEQDGWRVCGLTKDESLDP